MRREDSAKLERPASLLGKIPEALAQGDGDVLDQIGLRFDLPSLQVGDHFLPDADLLGERRRRQAGLKPQRPDALADPPGALRRLIGQMGAEFRVCKRADAVPGDLDGGIASRDSWQFQRGVVAPAS